MRTLFLIFLFHSFVLANFEAINSYYAHFVQTVVDNENATITYKGDFYAKRPFYALWQYKSPTPKSVYIKDRDITILEPDLEQAIIQQSQKSFTLFNILNDATKINATTYKKKVGDITYTLTLENDRIKTLHYIDAFENDVTITFSKTKSNIDLSAQSFKPTIPAYYDIIRQ